MTRAADFGCCKPRSSHGAARLHWTHASDCLLLPNVEIEPKSIWHPSDEAVKDVPWWKHPIGCICRTCVYVELNLDRDDDITDIEIDEGVSNFEHEG